MSNYQVQEYLTQGTVLSGHGKYEEALSYYDKAEQEDPMEIEVYLSKGIALANLERLDEAKEQFEKALKINKTSGIAYFHLGNIAVMQDDEAHGFENYNKAISNGYDDAQLYYSIGLLHEERGETDIAIRNYSKAIKLDVFRPDIRIRKAQLLTQTNKMSEAIQTLDELILINSGNYDGYHFKFNIFLQLKKYDEAEKLLDDISEEFADNHEYSFDRVSLLIERNETDNALKLLTQLENADNVDDSIRRRIYYDRAQIYAGNEDSKSIIAELEKAKALFEVNGDFDSESVFMISNCHLANEEYDKVLDYANQLFEKAEDGYEKETARYFIPLALKMLNRMDEALPLYEDAINEYRNQSLAIPGNLDAYLLRTMCLRDIEQYDKALELIDYVIELQPEQAEPRLLRVSILEALGRLDEAKKEANSANSMLPEELRKK